MNLAACALSIPRCVDVNTFEPPEPLHVVTGVVAVCGVLVSGIPYDRSNTPVGRFKRVSRGNGQAHTSYKAL